jgi:RNA polymerase sigma factor (sigma-70 family)
MVAIQRRTTVIDLFSTFMRFSADRFDGWRCDRRLQHNMASHLALGDNATLPEAAWPLYWYQRWQGHTHLQAGAHLQAYLQEPCYWAIHSILRRFSQSPWTIADGFQTAIVQTDRILKGYRPDYGSDLRGYARTAFSNLLRDQLRQQQDMLICSDWGLLRRLSHTQLRASLLAAGITTPESAILVWQCFKAVYTPDPRRSVRTLPPPSSEQFAQMTERYNQQRRLLHPVPPPLAGDAVVTSLQQAVQAVRSYLTPTVTSLNQSPSGATQPERLDDLGHDETPMAQLLDAEAYVEQQQRVQQMQTALTSEIATLAPADQTLLRLYYGEALTQTAIAQTLNIKQYQVSRQLSRVRQQLLLAIARWSQNTLHISLNSSVLASMSDGIHEWLQQRYSSEAEVGHELEIR